MPVDAVEVFLDEAVRLMQDISIPGTVTGVFTGRGVLSDLIHNQACTLMHDVSTQFSALAGMLLRDRSLLNALRAHAPNGVSLDVQDGAVILYARTRTRDQLFRPLGARKLASVRTTDLPDMPPVLGELARSLRPGSSCLVWSESPMTHHDRMHLLHQGPGIAAFAQRLTEGPFTPDGIGRWAVFPLSLFRFQDIAVLTDAHKPIAWMAVSPS